MRLIRFGEKGHEKPGLLNQGRIVDLTRLFPGIPDIDHVFFEDGWFEKVAAVDAEGDIISTGTPSGVGIFRDPPIVLKPGDIVECRVDSIGAIVNTVKD